MIVACWCFENLNFRKTVIPLCWSIAYWNENREISITLLTLKENCFSSLKGYKIKTAVHVWLQVPIPVYYSKSNFDPIEIMKDYILQFCVASIHHIKTEFTEFYIILCVFYLWLSSYFSSREMVGYLTVVWKVLCFSQVTGFWNNETKILFK